MNTSFSKRLIKTLSIFVISLFVASCGIEQSPTASDTNQFIPELEPAAKLPLPVEGLSISGLIGVLGGTLTVTDYNGPGVEDDIVIDFNVDSGALGITTLITMTVVEDTLSGDLIMDFSPDGLNFSNDAEIDVRVGEDLVERDVDDITAWHEHDETTEDATISYRNHSGGTVRVKIEVPGFSRYGLRRSY